MERSLLDESLKFLGGLAGDATSFSSLSNLSLVKIKLLALFLTFNELPELLCDKLSNTNSSSSSLITPGSALSSNLLRLKPVLGVLILEKLPEYDSASSAIFLSFFLPRLTLDPKDLANFFKPFRFSMAPRDNKLPPTDWAMLLSDDLFLSFLLRSLKEPTN